MQEETYTICAICEQACGIKVTTENNHVLKVEPDQDHAFSWRDFCIKGARSHLALTHPLRITTPMKRVGDRYVATSYEEAIQDISTRLKKIIKENGPEAVASYTGNPNGHNFGSALFQSLFLDAIGTRNRYWVGSIDQNALHVVSQALYGTPWVSLQTDIDYCDYFLLIGTNPAISTMCWIGYSPDGWKRLLARQAEGAKITVVDPRLTETANKADSHVAPLPESDWALLLAMIKIIFEHGKTRVSHREHFNGLDSIEAAARAADVQKLVNICDVPLQTIEQIALEFADAPRALAVARTGVSQGQNGVLALWLTQVLNVITGRMEAEGGVYYSSGILDLLIVGDKLFPGSSARSRIRGNLNVAGSHSLAELPDEITTPGDGQIRALIINSGNPVISGPDGNELDKALEKLECLVAVDHFQRESHRHADWLIPGDHFLERTEINLLLQSLTPAPRAQLAHAAVDPPADMRFEWEFFRDLALAMDAPLLAGKRWLNNLVRFAAGIGKLIHNRQFGLSPLWLSRLLVFQSKRFSWREIKKAKHGLGALDTRPDFGSIFGKLGTPDGRINLAPQEFLAQLSRNMTEPNSGATEYPLQMISRRTRNMMNSWSTETSAPVHGTPGDKPAGRLGDQIEVNLQDAQAAGIQEGETVFVTSETGKVNAVVTITERLRPGVVVMHQGWGSRTFNPAKGEAQHSMGVNRNQLVSNRSVDPLSRVPRLNGTCVRIERC